MRTLYLPAAVSEQLRDEICLIADARWVMPGCVDGRDDVQRRGQSRGQTVVGRIQEVCDGVYGKIKETKVKSMD